MAEIKVISENKLRNLAGEKKLNLIFLEKDFFLTALLFVIKDVKGIYFKGGTALNKIFLNHARLSEDLDFSSSADVKKEIISSLSKNKGIFPSWELERKTRIKVFYKSYFGKNSYIVLDINRKASILLPTQKHEVPHFYDEIPRFSVATLNKKEIAAEKVRALITRNQPRDYFDVYFMLKKGFKIDKKLVKKKVEEACEEFSVERIFRNADKIYSRWEDDITQLTNRPVKYMTVIKALQKEFRYKK